MAKIVKGMLLVSRKGSKDPLEPVALELVIEEIAAISAERFKFGDIELVIPQLPENFVALGRPTLLAQVLLNLLNNAYDAVKDLQERWVRLEISETKGARKGARKGSGLGLSISKEIITDLGGSLELMGDASHTTFLITLQKGELRPLGSASKET